MVAPMTEILLNAILNLFAIQAALLAPPSRAALREKVAAYLGEYLGLTRTEPYLDLFDLALEIQEGKDPASLRENAVRVTEELRQRLPWREQVAALVHFVEIVEKVGCVASGERIDGLVAESFHIEGTFLNAVRLFCGRPFREEDAGPEFLVHLPEIPPEERRGRGRNLPARRRMSRSFAVLRFSQGESYFCRSLDTDLFLDGSPLPPHAIAFLKPGSVLGTAQGERLHFSEIVAVFAELGEPREVLHFEGRHLEFRHPGSADAGVHDFSFSLSGGELVAVMGGSGSGKSTLLGVLTGRLAPCSGSLSVNGAEVTGNRSGLEGLFGYVPQDDLLFEDLTVFENLYYNARLCLADRSDEEIRRRCREVLEELQQPDIASLRVGTPLEKCISGGQRKRLNIALELLREPPVLFVDEPTSGLSSADAENVVALLKAQTMKGRLVVAVIHQPSSDVYKMFDRLWILDTGGRPIFDGNPLDALVTFRTAAYRAGNEEYACPHCGNVNPEQLFEIIEEKTVDDRGFATKTRRVSPEEWHARYLAHREETGGKEKSGPESGSGIDLPECRLWRPLPLGQFAVFLRRTFRSRTANGSYLRTTLLEPPFLGLLAGFLFRGSWGAPYVFRDNGNIPGYFFMSVVIAVFLGLSVSSGEIVRDRKVLERERLLHLSWGSYIAAKATYLAVVAFLQAGLYVLAGNALLQIPQMTLATWAILFSAAFCACMLGLNLSAAVTSSVAVYILIPMLLVPQIMLGGPTIPYDELLRKDAGSRNVPLVAEFMPTRWGYEALLVEHYRNSPFQRRFFDDENTRRWMDYLLGNHLPEVRGLAAYPFAPIPEETAEERRHEISRRLTALKNELAYLERFTGLTIPLESDDFSPESYGRETQRRVLAFLKDAEALLKSLRAQAAERRQKSEDALRAELGHAGFEALRNRTLNREVEKRVLGVVLDGDSVVLSGTRLVPKVLPIAQAPESRLGRAHLFAPFKRLGDLVISTPLFNLGVLWGMSLLLVLLLWSRVPERTGALLRRLRRGALSR